MRILSNVALSLLPPSRHVLSSGADSDADGSFFGGMRRGGYNATIPLVRLKLFPEGLRLESSSRLLRKLVPVWEAKYREITEAKAVGNTPLFSTGVRLKVGALDEWVIFWTVRREGVMAAIAEHGVTVDTRPSRFNFFRPET